MSTASDSRADATNPQAGFDDLPNSRDTASARESRAGYEDTIGGEESVADILVSTASEREAVTRRYRQWNAEYPEDTEDTEKETCDDQQGDQELPPYSPPAEDPNIKVTVTEVSWNSSESSSRQETPVGSFEDSNPSAVAPAVQIVEQSVTSGTAGVHTRRMINATAPVRTYPLVVDAITVERPRAAVLEDEEDTEERGEDYISRPRLSPPPAPLC